VPTGKNEISKIIAPKSLVMLAGMQYGTPSTTEMKNDPPEHHQTSNGEALCPQCGEFSKHHCANDTCGNNCRYDTMMNTDSVEVITWDNLIGRVESMTNEHHDFVAKHYPEILQALADKEADELAEWNSNRAKPSDNLGQSLIDMMAAIGQAQVMQQQLTDGE
jgi:hypothetical protein